MPPDRAQAILEDIRDASSFILEATTGKNREDYSRNRLLRQISEHERIIAFRNILIHGYDLVDDKLVWDTIKEKVPALLAEVEALIE